MTEHQAHYSAFAYLSEYGQFDCAFSHLETSIYIYGRCDVGTVRFLDVAKFTTQTPLSLLILCKLSFPIVGLRVFSMPTLELKSHNKILCGYLYGIY
jgi:hypothetical protein